jgi:hypothetical protein
MNGGLTMSKTYHHPPGRPMSRPYWEPAAPLDRIEAARAPGPAPDEPDPNQPELPLEPTAAEKRRRMVAILHSPEALAKSAATAKRGAEAVRRMARRFCAARATDQGRWMLFRDACGHLQCNIATLYKLARDGNWETVMFGRATAHPTRIVLVPNSHLDGRWRPRTHKPEPRTEADDLASLYLASQAKLKEEGLKVIALLRERNEAVNELAALKRVPVQKDLPPLDRFTVKRRGDHLDIDGPRAVPPDLMAMMHQNKTAILTWLGYTPVPPLEPLPRPWWRRLIDWLRSW